MSLLSRAAGQLRLLRQDPERFGRNLMQFTHRAEFERRLTAVTNAVPINVRYDPSLDIPPRLTVLDSAWSRTGMTGGPNTTVNLACRVARLGVDVRLAATVHVPSLDPAWFQSHAEGLVGGPIPPIPVVSAAAAGPPLPVGPRDLFMATHWSTARQLAPVLPTLPRQRFFYMLQEFEPGFYAWSSDYALAMATYGMDFWPIVNESLLADYLFAQPFGRLPDPALRADSMVFEPAVDATLFRAATERPATPRLLFYARPTNERNMFGLGLTALRAAAADPAFDGWQFLSIGGRGSVPALGLGGGRTLQPGPWVGYEGYGDLLRSADVLLCPMLSPHTSYPVLEMAACGGLSVTNSFANKTPEALAALSANILAAPPTVEALAAALIAAARRSRATPRAGSLTLPRHWSESLDPIAHRIATIVTGP